MDIYWKLMQESMDLYFRCFTETMALMIYGYQFCKLAKKVASSR